MWGIPQFITTEPNHKYEYFKVILEMLECAMLSSTVFSAHCKLLNHTTYVPSPNRVIIGIL